MLVSENTPASFRRYPLRPLVDQAAAPHARITLDFIPLSPTQLHGGRR